MGVFQFLSAFQVSNYAAILFFSLPIAIGTCSSQFISLAFRSIFSGMRRLDVLPGYLQIEYRGFLIIATPAAIGFILFFIMAFQQEGNGMINELGVALKLFFIASSILIFTFFQYKYRVLGKK